MAVADFFIAVVQAVDGADDEVGRKNLAVVDVAGNLDVDGQGRMQFDFRRAVVEQDDGFGCVGLLQQFGGFQTAFVQIVGTADNGQAARFNDSVV